MSNVNNSLGLYVHIPFCAKKCNYCNFYSFAPKNADVINNYVDDTVSEIYRWGERLSRPADSLYIGGGTPSLITTPNLNKIIDAAKKAFNLNEKSNEITVEINPKDDIDFKSLKANRISMGLQSANDTELSILGRRHNLNEAKETVNEFKKYFSNFSLDVIIGTPKQTKESLKNTLDFCINSNAVHISCYMLKIEKNTPFYNSNLLFLNDDEVSDLYLFTCDYLKEHGFIKYEISNFAKPGFYAKHNFKYWDNKDYLGIGPSAHSRIGNKRFYYSADLNDYLTNHKEIYEGTAGTKEEIIMLALRTNKGYNFKNEFKNNSNALLFLKKLKKAGYINLNGTLVRLTNKGCLTENTVIASILEYI